MEFSNNNNRVTKQVELTGMLAEFVEALNDEIKEIDKDGRSSILLYSGKQLRNYGNGYWYQFRVEYVPAMPSDTPCTLRVGKESYDVTVVSFDENSIIVSSDIALPEAIEKARLDNGAKELMERLIKCIEQNSMAENIVSSKMLLENGESYESKKIFSYSDLILNDENTDSQNAAIVESVSNDITYIWGPPGTGKTTVIGQIVDELYRHNRSVLVVSHTNTAVDGAIEKAVESYNRSMQQKSEPFPILRIGASTKRLDERVTLESHIAEFAKDIYVERKELEQQQKDIKGNLSYINAILAKNLWSNENNLLKVRQIIGDIEKIENKNKHLADEITNVKNILDNEKADNPEYKNYLTLERKYKPIKTELEEIKEKISMAIEDKGEMYSFIKQCEFEIEKHNSFNKLMQKSLELKSEQICLNEVNEIMYELEMYKNEKIRLLESIESYKAELERRSSTNFILKLVTNLSDSSTHIMKNLEIAKTRLKEVEIELDKLIAQKNDRTAMLKEWETLKQRMAESKPSKTLAHWRLCLDDTKVAISNTLKEISFLKKKEAELEVVAVSFISEIEKVKGVHSRILYLHKQLKVMESEFKNNDNQLVLLKDNAKALLEKDIDVVITFEKEFKQPITNVYAKFEQLNTVLMFVRQEIKGVKIDELLLNKEELEKLLLNIDLRLSEIQKSQQELEATVINNAQIVGTTLAKSYLSDSLRKRKFDTVILDEASMASIPALWCASILAENSLVIVGDFLQLPPIVIADTDMAKKWLGTDIFCHNKINELAKNRITCPKNFVMLNNQFRMEADIADVANIYYEDYGGLLSDDTNTFRVKEREAFYAWYNFENSERNIHLIDTENLHAWVTSIPQGKNHSRLNCFSASVTVDLAFKILENIFTNLDVTTAKAVDKPKVLIVAPYKPHVVKIKSIIEFEYKNRGYKENLNYIRVGTIHSFQGSEADIVIFDLVIDEPHWKANLFVPNNDELRNMFNVAITRAKFKLFVVGNFNYCKAKAKGNPLGLLLNRLFRKSKNETIDAKKLLPNLLIVKDGKYYSDAISNKHIICREDAFHEPFITDIINFKNRLIIYSPFISANRLSILLPYFNDAVKAKKQIIVVTKAHSDRRKSELENYIKFEEQLKFIGVKVIHKKGMHEKLIFVDREALWMGSLNALSFSGATGEVMQRQADSSLIEEYEKLYDIEHIMDVNENDYKQSCPVCKKELILKESASGGIYWNCECGYSRNPKQPYPKDGILLCKKCGAPYKLNMDNEPRWICTKNTGHFQKVSSRDLRFSDMFPTNSIRKKVERYLNNKEKTTKQQQLKANKKVKVTSKVIDGGKNKKSIEQISLF